MRMIVRVRRHAWRGIKSDVEDIVGIFQVKVGDMLIGVASSPENPMFVIQSFDQVHDMLLGAAGTQVHTRA